jgi:6-phosphogluconolactonase
VAGELRCVTSPDSLFEIAAALFVAAAVDAIRTRSTFTVALAGGSTPRNLYLLLARDAERSAAVDWTRVQFFWGDERLVPPDHARSNFRMACETMLDRLPIDPARVRRIKGEYPDAPMAAEEYEQDLSRAFAAGDGELPRFDLVLLGLGADGHTASLFPAAAALHEQQRWVVATQAPSGDVERITLTPPIINNALEVIFLVSGADKAEALRGVLEGPFDPDRLPAQLIAPRDGRLIWLMDTPAAHLLSSERRHEGERSIKEGNDTTWPTPSNT